MGFLETVRRTFNISGAEITIVTNDEVHSQFDAVAGEVIVRGGEYACSGASIKLELKEFWTETRSTGNTTTTVTVYAVREEVTLTNAFSIEPRSERSYPFEVQLPMNCRISTKGTGWCLVVAMDIPKAIDPKAKAILNVEPAEEFLAIIDACESSLRFEEDVRKRRWKKKKSETHFRLLPPNLLKPELDYLRLELRQTGDGSVTGQLVFDLQEKSIADYFRAAINFDQVKKPIRFSRDRLFLPDGDTNQEELTTSIGQCLEEILRERRG